MICNKHKEVYIGKCPNCDAEEKLKEHKLKEAMGSKRYATAKWVDNPVYNGGRKYRVEFRTKVHSALVFLTKFYGMLLDQKKSASVESALRGNLDDLFIVASDDPEWTNVVHALGGKHNDAVYSPTGKLLGVMQSFGCTTYSWVDIDKDTKQVTPDEMSTFKGLFEDSKRIYLHGADVNLSTVIHEMLHFFSSSVFYQKFAAKGVTPEWKGLNEGITEYLTRKAYTGDNHGSYQAEFEQVQMLIATGLPESDIQEAYFQGKIANLVEWVTSHEQKNVGVGMAGRMAGAGGRQPRFKPSDTGS